MAHAELIDALGCGRLAEVTRVGPSAVSNWKHRGIPWRWRPLVATIAKEDGVEVPAGFLNPAEDQPQ